MRLFAGQSAWVAQRLSAVVLLLLLLVAALAAAFARPGGIDGSVGSGFASWRALMGSAHGAVLTMIGFIAAGVHAWIGVRDIVLDYLHRPALRLAVLLVVALALTGVQLRVLLTLARAFSGGA